MGKKLAIKGHSSRGKEVIELLEMLGGNNIYKFSGFDGYAYYVIAGCQNKIKAGEYIFGDEDMHLFTLEEFWEKYPIKIGDEVTDLKTDKIAEVYKMHWSENNSCIYYDIKYPNNCGCQRRLMDLKPTNDVDDVHSISECKTIGQGTYAIKIADGYRFDSIDENGDIIVKSIKPVYPKTYNECYNILNCFSFTDVEQYNFENDWRLTIKDKNYGNIMNAFVKLLICRDTYWKIAGEEMGLGKPWEPDLENEELYCIQNYNKQITISRTNTAFNKILIFPTEKMRDVFYENFKDLIEQCKELL